MLAGVQSDFESGKEFIKLEVLHKQTYWLQMPWTIIGVAAAITRPRQAREHINKVITDFDGMPRDATIHHRLTLLWLSGPLRRELDSFVGGVAWSL